MNRFEFVLDAAFAPHQVPLPDLARQFSTALDQVQAEGADPTRDPAVLILGAFIAFHTHADVNTVGGYHRLLDLCAHRLETSKEEMQ